MIMNILLITDAYPPEIRSISFMVQELAEGLALKGNNVTVATCWPQYNLADDVKMDNFREYAMENDICVIRVKTPPHHKVDFITRGISQLSLPYLFLRRIKKLVKYKIDAVIVYTPPLPLGILGIRIKKLYGARFILNVQDIFPQNAIDLGAIVNKLVIKFFERMENKIYQSADRITSYTENSRKFLIDKKLVPAEKISTIYNWIDFDAFKNVKVTGAFRRRYDLTDKFIFLFPGIMGPSQSIDFIIRVAKKVEDIPDICFLFVGDGTEKQKLQKIVEQYGLQNVKFEPFVSRKDYVSLVKEADVGITCLSIKSRTPVIPGKILGFMASSVPIVAFLNKESDAHRLIQESGCGYSMLSTDENMAAVLIRKVYNEKNRLAEYGRNGYNYAMAHFSKELGIDKLASMI